MNKMFLSAVIALTTVTAQASLLTLKKEVKKVDVVSVAAGATANVDGKALDLTTLGAGLRSKKVLFMNVKVYVGQLMTDNVGAVDLKNPNAVLANLGNNNASAFTMTFVRSVTSDQLTVAFRDGFNANNVDMNAAPIKDLLAAVTAAGDVSTNDTLTFLVIKNADGSEDVLMENQKGVVTKISGAGDKTLSVKVLSLWIGNGADAGVTDLKNQILRGL